MTPNLTPEIAPPPKTARLLVGGVRAVPGDGIGGNRCLHSADQAEPAVERNRLAAGKAQLSGQVISRHTEARVKLDRV